VLFHSNPTQKLQAVHRVVQGRAAIIALLDCEDYFSAMELIAAAKKVGYGAGGCSDIAMQCWCLQ
jgi:dihydrodipicolinate synthase/N-acetylneuraminate lyase